MSARVGNGADGGDRQKAGSDNAADDRFVAILCHELRDPLPAIIGAALAIDPPAGNPEQFDRMLAIVLRPSLPNSPVLV